MAIKPLNRVATARKDGQATGASSMTNHTRLRIEDAENNYVGLFDASNRYVEAVSQAIEDLGLIVLDNVQYNKDKDQTPESSSLVLKPKTAVEPAVTA